MRPIKFRFVRQHCETGRIASETYTLDEIQAGTADDWAGYETIAKLQFTGLHDKNGKEIYEGDIVTAHNFYFNGDFDNDNNGTYKVLYEQESCGFFLLCIDDPDSGLHFYDTSHFEEPCIEVIGNIYENPDLLSQQS